MSAADRSVIQVSQPVKAQLDALKAEQEAQRKRQVSFSEVIEQLMEKARAAA